MFRLEDPSHLIFLLAIPLLLALFLLMRQWRRQTMKKWGDTGLLERLTPQRSEWRMVFKFVLVAMALVCMGLAYANPQWGTKREKAKRKSSDVFIALDISKSMNVKDLAPSRLERAKKFARKLVNQLGGERIGVIAFAGNAYVLSPLTVDYSAADQFIDSANPHQISTQGTSIDAALELAELSFPKDDDQHRAVIIISDGENHDPEAIAQAKAANERGVLIFTVGAGTTEGGYIPLQIAGYNEYQRNKNGELVKSKLNEGLLKEIAEAGGGEYYNIVSGEEAVLSALERNIAKIEKRAFEQRMFDEYESYFWVFLIPALLLLVSEFVLSYRKSNVLSGRDIFANQR